MSTHSEKGPLLNTRGTRKGIARRRPFHGETGATWLTVGRDADHLTYGWDGMGIYTDQRGGEWEIVGCEGIEKMEARDWIARAQHGSMQMKSDARSMQ